MKKRLLIYSALIFSSTISAQNTFINENFDAYTVNGFLAVQSDVWDTWTQSPGGAEDGVVSNDVAFSGTNSMRINTTTQDMVLPIGPYTSSLYTIEFMMYMPQGNGGYFNILHSWPAPFQWACQVYFHSDGTINWTAGMAPGSTAQGAGFTSAQWFKVMATINMDTDLATVNINNVDLFSFVWSLDDSNGAAGLNQLAAVNFFGATAVGSGPPVYYIDDVIVTDVNGVNVFEAIASPLTVFPIPTHGELNISGLPSVPSAVSLTDLSGKVVYSETSNRVRVNINTSALTGGLYLLSVQNQLGSHKQKVIVTQ